MDGQERCVINLFVPNAVQMAIVFLLECASASMDGRARLVTYPFAIKIGCLVATHRLAFALPLRVANALRSGQAMIAPLPFALRLVIRNLVTSVLDLDSASVQMVRWAVDVKS